MNWRSAAGSLAGRPGPQYHEEATAALRRMISVYQGTRGYDGQSAVKSLAGLAPQYHEEAAAALREMIADQGIGSSDRRSAAGSLARPVP